MEAKIAAKTETKRIGVGSIIVDTKQISLKIVSETAIDPKV